MEQKDSATASLPQNFSWVEKDLLAGSGCPTETGHFKYFQEAGIDHVISLKEKYTEGAQEDCEQLKLRLSQIQLRDFHPPNQDQIEQFMKSVEEGMENKKAVVVHCALGRGRTGTMLACYLVKHKNLTAKEAIAEIRKLRPGSVETNSQEKAIEAYYQHLMAAKGEK